MAVVRIFRKDLIRAHDYLHAWYDSFGEVECSDDIFTESVACFEQAQIYHPALTVGNFVNAGAASRAEHLHHFHRLIQRRLPRRAIQERIAAAIDLVLVLTVIGNI